MSHFKVTDWEILIFCVYIYSIKDISTKAVVVKFIHLKRKDRKLLSTCSNVQMRQYDMHKSLEF